VSGAKPMCSWAQVLSAAARSPSCISIVAFTCMDNTKYLYDIVYVCMCAYTMGIYITMIIIQYKYICLMGVVFTRIRYNQIKVYTVIIWP